MFLTQFTRIHKKCIFLLALLLLFIKIYAQEVNKMPPITKWVPGHFNLSIQNQHRPSIQHPSNISKNKKAKTLISSNSSLASNDFPGYNYPLNDCFTYTYKMSIGDPSPQTTIIKKTFLAKGGVTYIIGYSTTASTTRGFVQEISMTGTIAWSQLYGLAGQDLQLNAISQLPNYNLIIAGTIGTNNPATQRPFIAEIDNKWTP